MTRIVTNISSLLAQQSLAASNTQLQSALTQLSTGKRINSGADDPSGLIASESLASNIVNTNQAISNSQLASNMISTADSSLSQIGSLLTTIQGLVNQSASTGTMSASQIAANQQQIDAALNSINQIATTTSFQGKNLLDGTLGFTTAAGSGAAGTSFTNNVTTLQVNQANLGGTGSLGVYANITSAASGAFLKTAIPALGGAAAPATGTTAAFANGGTITVTAKSNGPQYNGVQLVFQTSATTPALYPTATYNAAAKQIIVQVNDLATTTQDAVAAAISATTPFTATASDLGGGTTVISPLAGKDFGAGLAAGLVLTTINAGLASGANAGGGLGNANGVSFTLTGSLGSQNFSFAQGTTADIMANTINQSTSQTGVYALNSANTLELTSTNPNAPTSNVGYGSAAKVQVAVTGGAFDNAVQNSAGTTAASSTGTDVVGTVNGVTATGSGNTLSVDNSGLSMNMTVAPTTTGAIAFNVTGGGATFQIGANVGSGGQATLGVQNVGTTSLGGTAGSLQSLYSNGTAALATNSVSAAAIVGQAITQVSTLRGQLGSFQSETLDSNINALNSAVSNLTSAKSSISDADFAAESAALTQAQVLVQSGTAVLSIANHAPENVLSLLK
jgi:flagellin